jgi:hypothetical protein
MKRTPRLSRLLVPAVLLTATPLLGMTGCSSSPGVWFPSLDTDSGSLSSETVAVCATPLVEPCSACASDSDCGTILGVTNAACDVATGICESISCASNRDCPSMEVCNTRYGYCVDRSDATGCTNMKCSGDSDCPCSGSVCAAFDGSCT